MLDVKVMSVIY